MITTVLLAQVMVYLVLCVWDIVAAARACWSIIPMAIFGLLWTFLLTTYVWQWYLLNTWLSLFYLPRSCCIWYYMSRTMLPWPEHAGPLFPQPYLDSCGPFFSEHMSSNHIFITHQCHGCSSAEAAVVLWLHLCYDCSCAIAAVVLWPQSFHGHTCAMLQSYHGTLMICILCWSCSATVL